MGIIKDKIGILTNRDNSLAKSGLLERMRTHPKGPFALVFEIQISVPNYPNNEKSRYSQRISIFTTAIITNKLIRGIAELQLKACPIFLPFQIAISTRPYLNILKHFRDGPHCLVNLIFSTV